MRSENVPLSDICVATVKHAEQKNTQAYGTGVNLNRFHVASTSSEFSLKSVVHLVKGPELRLCRAVLHKPFILYFETVMIL